MGGHVLYAGKPHRPIYDAALAKAAHARAHQRHRAAHLRSEIRCAPTSPGRALGIDGLFVSGGIHAEELGPRETPSTDALSRMFASAGVTPLAVTPRLVW